MHSKKIVHFFVLVVVTFTTFNCSKSVSTTQDNYAYLGGEIINPSSDSIFLLKSNKVIDTLFLNSKNRFLYKFDSLQPGIYGFRLEAYNGFEFQLALLEPKDSLMLRLNTLDFDESLMFTGIGAKKNNFLINMFLQNEKDNKKVLQYSQLEPIIFEKRLDSLRAARTNHLNLFVKKYNPSQRFQEIAQANINYNYYISKEIYPFAYFGDKNIHKITELPANFYNYRKELDYNNLVLKDYFTYYAFLRYHIKNLAVTEFIKNPKNEYFNRNSLRYNLIKLQLIDSLIQNKNIKNELLYITSLNYFNANKNASNYHTFLNSFLEKSSSKDDQKKITKLVENLKSLRSGKKIPNLELLTLQSKKTSFQKIIKKPTVIYFWTIKNKSHFKEAHHKIASFRKKYPALNFIGINIDAKAPQEIKQFLKQYNFSIENELQFNNPELAKEKLVINPITKVLLINKYGTIKNGNANLFAFYFDVQLKNLQK